MPKLAFGLGFKGPQVGQFQKILAALYRIYLERDASLLEVNPLIVTKSGDLMALDAKINIDANAMFRQKELAAEIQNYALHTLVTDGYMGQWYQPMAVRKSLSGILQGPAPYFWNIEKQG